jgi:hypothetical protein
MLAWYRTDAGLSGTNDGDPIFLWDDLSGNGNTMTQGNPSQRPIFKTGVLQGRDALRFSNASDQLLNRSGALGVSGNLHEAFIVMKASTWVNGMVLLALDAANTMTFAGNNSIAGFYVYTLTPHGLNLDSGDGSSPVPHIMRIRKATGQQYLTIGTVIEDGTGNSGVYTIDKICLGAQSSSDVATTFNGDIGEVLIYNGNLSVADVNQVKSYLQGRWGLTFI